jgi:hypothetical protein
MAAGCTTTIRGSGMTTTTRDRRAATLALLAMLAAMTAWLLHRNLGLYPAIFADEWYYSKMSRLMPLKDALVPSYLYLWLFRASNACGDSFLDCVRIGNVLFFVAGAPFVYLVARRVTGPPLALLAALVALLAPLNMYTAFFMPEAMYYFGFCVLSWVALAFAGWPWPRHALATGLLLGLMSLVKVHALFLLPALGLFMVYLSRGKGDGHWLRTGLASAALAALAALAVRLGLGYLLAGDAAFNLFGALYSETTTSVAHRSPLRLLGPALVSARGHAMALAVLWAFPLALLGHALASRAARERAGRELTALHMYALLMLAAAVAMTVAYTASIAYLGPVEMVRLHLRYYSFVFPLLFLAGAAALGQPARRPRHAWAIALPLALLLLLALAKLPLHPNNEIDGPDIAALHMTGTGGRLVVGLDLLILFLWALGSRLAAVLFVFAAVPALLWPGTVSTNAYLRQLVPGWGPDNAGLAVRRFVPKAERAQVTVAGTVDQDMMRSQFHIDDKDTAMLRLPKGAPVAPEQIPEHDKWLLVLGQHALPDGVEPVVANADYTLARLNVIAPRTGEAALSEPFGPEGLIASAEGMSGAEAWGRWSDAQRVVLRFNAPFPRQMEVRLTARAYTLNAGLPFTMRIGSHAASFRLGTTPGEVRLRFQPGYNQRTLVIEVPHPVSPASLGQSKDARLLGIGISRLGIEAVAEATLTSSN